MKNKMLAVDLFKRPFKLLMPGGDDEYRTFLGSLISIFILCLILGFAGYKLGDLIEFNDYKLQEAEQENFFKANETFTAEQGFQVAACITSYDGSSKVIEDPTIGELKMYTKAWDALDPETKGSLIWTELETHLCKKEDLNDVDGSNKNSKFFKTDPVSEADLITYGPKMRCLAE